MEFKSVATISPVQPVEPPHVRAGHLNGHGHGNADLVAARLFTRPANCFRNINICPHKQHICCKLLMRLLPIKQRASSAQHTDNTNRCARHVAVVVVVVAVAAMRTRKCMCLYIWRGVPMSRRAGRCRRRATTSAV